MNAIKADPCYTLSTPYVVVVCIVDYSMVQHMEVPMVKSLPVGLLLTTIGTL